MDLPINHNEPTIMHIDLNSCFATVEQQANPLLRGKPIAVAAYISPNGCVVSPSIEAKKYGIKVGMRVREAKLFCRDLIILPPDPAKYRDVHVKFRHLFMDYSPLVTPKSIDEAIIDFAGTPGLKRGLVNIGIEIKQRMKKEVGEWISCNIGIATNRFLAKQAASLHKPDGLDVITHENVLDIYRSLNLIDLTGINTRYQARLNVHGIFTPTQFFDAPVELLTKQVFQSINGYYWYLRLRGWEIDAVVFGRKSIGHMYSLKKPTNDPQQLSMLLMKLCEKVGRRLRRNQLHAKAVYVACLYRDHTHWHTSRHVSSDLYTSTDIFKKLQYVLNQQPERKIIINLAVGVFDLCPSAPTQLDLFDSEITKRNSLSDAMDKINDKYGEFIITPALMMGMGDTIVDRVPFGSTKDIEDMYLENTF